MLEEATESFQLQLLKEEENGDDSLTVERLTSDISPVIRLVDSTIYTAIQRRASDIHIETADEAVHVKYRIDGVLQPAMRPIAKQFHSSIISRIKVMAELDIAEKRVPQDGRFKLRMPGKTIDFRVSIMPSVHGEDAVIRILDKESISEQFTELRLDILGFPEAELKRFRKYIAEPYGMVLVTGPTGSGKTTTLYAALSEIKSIEDKIITIEDPVEYQLKGHHADPDQREEGADVRARPAIDPAPRSRQDHGRRDPRQRDRADRDQLGADRPSGVHDRAREQRARRARPLPEHGRRGVPVRVGAELRAGAAAGPQHLRRTASGRRRSTRALLEESGLDPALEHTHTFYEGVGCIECGGTGYKGRTAICELLDLTDRIREMILEKRPTSEIKKAAREEGMRFLRESAVERVMQGITTLREINKVTFVE